MATQTQWNYGRLESGRQGRIFKNQNPPYTPQPAVKRGKLSQDGSQVGVCAVACAACASSSSSSSSSSSASANACARAALLPGPVLMRFLIFWLFSSFFGSASGGCSDAST